MKIHILDTTGETPLTLSTFSCDSVRVAGEEVTIEFSNAAQRKAALGELAEEGLEFIREDSGLVTVDMGSTDREFYIIC